MKASLVGLATALVMTTTAVWAGTIVVKPTTVTEWKAVYGKVETRDTNAALAELDKALADFTWSRGSKPGVHTADVQRVNTLLLEAARALPVR